MSEPVQCPLCKQHVRSLKSNICHACADPHVKVTGRGFEVADLGNGVELQQSSEIGDYDDSLKFPGSSALWATVPEKLDREDAALLARYLDRWARTGYLAEWPPELTREGRSPA